MLPLQPEISHLEGRLERSDYERLASVLVEARRFGQASTCYAVLNDRNSWF
jgi:hypothetical protein